MQRLGDSASSLPMSARRQRRQRQAARGVQGDGLRLDGGREVLLLSVTLTGASRAGCLDGLLDDGLERRVVRSRIEREDRPPHGIGDRGELLDFCVSLRFEEREDDERQIPHDRVTRARDVIGRGRDQLLALERRDEPQDGGPAANDQNGDAAFADDGRGGSTQVF